MTTETYTDPWTGETGTREVIPPPDLGRAWCPECRTMRQVEDRFTDSTMTRRGEMEYHVTALACGHQDQGPEHRVADAPGAPYAGPGVAVATGTGARALRAARERQRDHDARQEA